MKFPKFHYEFNAGHVAAILAICSTGFGVWRAIDTQASDTRTQLMLLGKEQIGLHEMTNRRLSALEDREIALTSIVNSIQINQAKVATVLEEHLKMIGNKEFNKP